MKAVDLHLQYPASILLCGHSEHARPQAYCLGTRNGARAMKRWQGMVDDCAAVVQNIFELSRSAPRDPGDHVRPCAGECAVMCGHDGHASFSLRWTLTVLDKSGRTRHGPKVTRSFESMAGTGSNANVFLFFSKPHHAGRRPGGIMVRVLSARWHG